VGTNQQLRQKQTAWKQATGALGVSFSANQGSLGTRDRNVFPYITQASASAFSPLKGTEH